MRPHEPDNSFLSDLYRFVRPPHNTMGSACHRTDMPSCNALPPAAIQDETDTTALTRFGGSMTGTGCKVCPA
jgi:hypothetical protein